jgi:tetratricopeptide (TPR) repeat protein
MQRPGDELLLEECRTLAGTASWGALRAAVEQFLANAPTQPAPLSPTVVVLYAESLMRTGHPQAARRWLEERDGALRLSGERSAIRRAANLLGAACLELGDLDAASDVFEQAIELARTDSDDLLLARSTNNLAVIASIRGKLPEALGLYSLVVPAYQRIGNVNGIAESYHNTAIALRKLQRLDQADEHERRAAEFARQVSNARLVALTRVGRAEIFLLRGDAALAEATAARGAAELASIPDQARQADALRVCGVARLTLGRFADALDAFNDAVALAVAHGNRLIEAEARWARAQLLHGMNRIAETLDDATVASSIFEQLHARIELQMVRTWLSARGYAIP